MLRLLKYCSTVLEPIAIFFSPTVTYDDSWRRKQKEDTTTTTSYSIDSLPNEIFLCISEHLTKKDCVTCMCVCKLWFNRFFERVYGTVYLTETSQIASLYNVVTGMDHALTETVSALHLDYRVTWVIWTNFSRFQQLLVLCPNIRTLDLSFWQLYFLLHPTHNNFEAVLHLRQLRSLTIRSTYSPDLEVRQRSKEDVGLIAGHRRDSRADPLFRRSKLVLEMIQHTPKLDHLAVYFHRTEDPWMTEKDLEAIHTYCPSLHTLLLKNTIWTLADHESINACHPVAERMRRLTLGNIEFQDNAGFFWQYILRKYRNVIYAAIWKIRMRDEETSTVTMADGSFWRDLRTFEFKHGMANTADICKSFLTQMGSNIVYLALGGHSRHADKKRRWFTAISVDLSWIEEVCASLKTLKLTYAVLYTDGQEALIRPSGQLDTKQFVIYLSLQRTSHVGPWHIQELNRPSMLN